MQKSLETPITHNFSFSFDILTDIDSNISFNIDLVAEKSFSFDLISIKQKLIHLQQTRGDKNDSLTYNNTLDINSARSFLQLEFISKKNYYILSNNVDNSVNISNFTIAPIQELKLILLKNGSFMRNCKKGMQIL